VILFHSQAGAFGFKVAQARPDKVKALVAVEPAVPGDVDKPFPFFATFSPLCGYWRLSRTLGITVALGGFALSISPDDRGDVRHRARALGPGVQCPRGFRAAMFANVAGFSRLADILSAPIAPRVALARGKPGPGGLLFAHRSDLSTLRGTRSMCLAWSPARRACAKPMDGHGQTRPCVALHAACLRALSGRSPRQQLGLLSSNEGVSFHRELKELHRL
jgi:pimeloyl-ACP methyl ester carboxylesterase